MQDTECFVLESSMFHINYCPSCFRLTHDLTFNCYHATTKGVDLDLLILDLQDSYFCIACCVRWALYMEKRLFGWLSGGVTDLKCKFPNQRMLPCNLFQSSRVSTTNVAKWALKKPTPATKPAVDEISLACFCCFLFSIPWKTLE